MPVDAMLVSLAVTVVFVAFALVLAWADHHTQSQADRPPLKRRGF
jgi:hypothetical protein